MNNINTNQHPDQVVCRGCGEKRVKTFGKIAGNGRTVWVDQFGERWYGKKCPQCYKSYKEEYDTKHRLKLGYRPFGSFDNCVTCGNKFLIKVGSTTKCPDCKAKRIKEQMES